MNGREDVPMFATVRFVAGTVASDEACRRAPVRSLARLGRWVYRKRKGITQTIPIAESGNLRIALPNEDWTAYVADRRPQPERELLWLRDLLRPGMNAIDVGAHWGIWTMLMADAVGPAGRLIAFEPAWVTADLLERGIASNGLSNARVVRAAVGDQRGMVRLYHHARNSRMNSLTPMAGSFEDVPVVCLDDTPATRELGPISVIKIDAEGNDVAVVRGAKETLRRDRPVVIFEVNPAQAQARGVGLGETSVLLQEFGYVMHRIDDGGQPVSLKDIRDAQDHPLYWNVVALHPEGQIGVELLASAP